MTSALYIGTMSGTSADGLDIVITEINHQHSVRLVHTYFAPYPDKLREHIKQLQLYDSKTLFHSHKDSLEALDVDLASFYSHHIAECLKQANISTDSIKAIGNHGQTILHQPNASKPFSLQLCNAQKLADDCNIPVIGNFRQADIQQGGQGAPLMPAFHAAIFAANTPCAIVNIGGISNTTLLTNDTVLGFDNGPGNTLMDVWIHQHQNLAFDKNGDWARSGTVHHGLLSTLLAEPFFSTKIPKSTGQDLFNPHWLSEKITEFLETSPADVQATLCELTAQCIIDDIEKYAPNINELYICGGGAKNRFLLERLQNLAGEQRRVLSTNHLGVDSDWVEAMGFAWLAYCHQHQLVGNMPSVTGASKAVILGEAFQADT